MRALALLAVLVLGAAALLTVAAQQTPVVVEHLEYPRAKHFGSWPREADDVTLAIDRNGDYYLDNGDGDMRQIPNDSLASILNQVYRDRQKDRVLYFLADSNTEYHVILNVLDMAYEAGVRVLAAVAEGEREGTARIRTGMVDIQIGKGLDANTVSEIESPPGFMTLAQIVASGNVIVLQLLADGSYEINQEPVVFSQLSSRIRSIFENRPAKLMFIESPGNRRYQDVITAMDISRGAGVQVVGIWISPIEVPRGLPPIDLSDRFDPRQYGGGAIDLTEVFTEAVVDEVPERLACPVPQYPPEMVAANIEGTVLLQFVLETDGHVNRGAVEILQSTHEAFEAPARAMIVGCRFRPGRVRKQAVRVLVQMPVVFALAKIGERSGGPQMRISAIVLTTRDEAGQVLERLNAGDDFATLAGAHTTGVGKDAGGDLGYFRPSELMPELGAVAMLLEVGQHSDIIETEIGFLIIKKTDERQAQDVEQLERDCEAGDDIACAALGTMYRLGDGVPRDYKTALMLLEAACDAGVAVACSNLGVMYEIGLGVPKDEAHAASLFRKACDGGVSVACR
jgi:TonB family protein